MLHFQLHLYIYNLTPEIRDLIYNVELRIGTETEIVSYHADFRGKLPQLAFPARHRAACPVGKGGRLL